MARPKGTGNLQQERNGLWTVRVGVNGRRICRSTGTADRAVPISCSKSVVAELEQSGNNSRLRYDWLPGASHGALARVFYIKEIVHGQELTAELFAGL